MVTITNVNLNIDTNDSVSGNGNFQIESNIKGSKVVNFFELLYSHPNKYKIKCNALDELKTDLFLPSNYDALENNLPIVIHSRDSFNEIYKVLKKFKSENLRGIFHCFTGNKEQAKKIIDLNFHLGIGGVVTFKNGKISDFLSSIPIERIVLETDSPYLAPSPYRGKRNESSYLKIIAEKIADLYNLQLSEVSKITHKNSIDIFGN